MAHQTGAICDGEPFRLTGESLQRSKPAEASINTFRGVLRTYASSCETVIGNMVSRESLLQEFLSAEGGWFATTTNH